MKRRTTVAFLVFVLVLVVLGVLFGGAGCSSPVPNRVPMGEPFPAVDAQPLGAEEAVAIPGAFGGAPLLLLVGYVQDAQFDIDRWLFGVLDAELDVALREVPAARGMAASLASGFIDSGMRRGIPQEDWGAVATTYGDRADRIARFTGTEHPRNARVILLDGQGVVRWFHDDGYSARALIELRERLAELRGAGPGGD